MQVTVSIHVHLFWDDTKTIYKVLFATYNYNFVQIKTKQPKISQFLARDFLQFKILWLEIVQYIHVCIYIMLSKWLRNNVPSFSLRTGNYLVHSSKSHSRISFAPVLSVRSKEMGTNLQCIYLYITVYNTTKYPMPIPQNTPCQYHKIPHANTIKYPTSTMFLYLHNKLKHLL